MTKPYTTDMALANSYRIDLKGLIDVAGACENRKSEPDVELVDVFIRAEIKKYISFYLQ